MDGVKKTACLEFRGFLSSADGQGHWQPCSLCGAGYLPREEHSSSGWPCAFLALAQPNP